MTKITTIFLDLDGCIAAMNQAVCAHLNIPYTENLPTDEEVYELSGGRKQFWSWFGTRNFFANLPLYPWSKELVDVVDKSGLDWVFLSKSTINDGVSSGKSQWVRDNFPKYVDRLWLARGSKSRASGPGKILIDDKMVNLVEWQCASGTGFLWKELHPSQTEEAARRIEELKLVLTNGAE